MTTTRQSSTVSAPVPSVAEREACGRYDQLAEEVSRRPATAEEAAWLLQHEQECDGKHSTAALEAEVGVAPGALTNGSVEDGILSTDDLVARIRSRL